MRLKKVITSIALTVFLSGPLAVINRVEADDADGEVEASAVNTAAKQYSYGGTTYLYKLLQTQGIKYNCFYANGNKIKYRYGKPEGIVIRETAAPGASAYNEAIYFNREWMNMYAYVHAFVDHSGVIQMMTPNYGTWGAGPKANNRFIQIELCQESTRNNFAKSVNNDAIYAAHLLHRYNLTPSNASNTGKGTIWSHHAVSRFLGGTDHTDPDGYFAKWGYSMNQFYALVKYYYNLQDGSSAADTSTNETTVSPAPSPAAKTLMHDAYVYDGTGKRTNSALKTAGTKVTITGEKTINNRKYLQIGKDEYLVASNITGTSRVLRHNAYLYDTVGQRVGTAKLYRAARVRTYGGRVTIQGTKYFQISPTEFVKAANF